MLRISQEKTKAAAGLVQPMQTLQEQNTHWIPDEKKNRADIPVIAWEILSEKTATLQGNTSIEETI